MRVSALVLGCLLATAALAGLAAADPDPTPCRPFCGDEAGPGKGPATLPWRGEDDPDPTPCRPFCVDL